MSLPTKELDALIKDAPAATSLSDLSMLCADSSGNLKKMAAIVPMLLARLLMPWATIRARTVNYYSRAEWLYFAKGETFWGMVNGQPNELLIITGTTTDTNQKFVYYFYSTRIVVRADANDLYGKCFLLLLEGEPPRWINTE